MLLLLAIAAASAACPAPASPEALLAHAARAEQAFAQMDAAAFREAHGALTDGVACLEVVLTPKQAGQVHRISALAAFLDRDEPRTIAAFQALAAADPDHQLADWLPDRHPLHVERRYALRFEEDAAVALRVPNDTTLWVDGVAARQLVPSRPAVLQQHRAGALTDSHLWQPGADLPAGVAFVEPGLSPRLQRRLWLGAGTVATAAATTGLLLWSSALSDAYLDPDTPYSELEGLDRRVFATSVAGIGSGVLAAGLGTTLVVLW